MKGCSDCDATTFLSTEFAISCMTLPLWSYLELPVDTDRAFRCVQRAGIQTRPDQTRTDHDFVMSVSLRQPQSVFWGASALTDYTEHLKFHVFVCKTCIFVASYRRLLAAGPISIFRCYYVWLILFKGFKSSIYCPRATGFERVDVQEKEFGICF